MHFHDLASKVLVFDWDDTICPSSFVDNYEIDHISELPLDVSQSVASSCNGNPCSRLSGRERPLRRFAY